MAIPRRDLGGSLQRLFRATPQQVRALTLLLLLLVGVIYWPGMQWALSAVLRRNPLQVSHVEASVPRSWIAVSDDPAIEAWFPCFTIFCSMPRSSMKIQVEETLIGKERAWLSRAETALRDRKFSRPASHSLDSRAGSVRCLESPSDTRINVMDSVCFASESGLVASFEGLDQDLPAFYSIVESARSVVSKQPSP